MSYAPIGSGGITVALNQWGRAMTDPDTVAILAHHGCQMLDVAGPLEAFAIASHRSPHTYEPVILGIESGPVGTSNGFAIGPAVAYRDADFDRIDTLIVAGGSSVHALRRDQALIGWLRQSASKVRRVCSVCTGAFLLAEAGLLNGKRVVTHWESATRLASEFPDIDVDPDAIYCAEGQIWTSAGITAGMDMALGLIEDDLGRDVALSVARQMVLYLKRPGGQSQFSAELLAQEKSGDRFDRLRLWIFDNLDRPLGVEELADRAGMSRRSFQRRFTEAFGQSPAKFVEHARIEAARRDLESTSHGLDRIAEHRGFGDAERMRRSFHRVLGLPPSAYRARFRAVA